MTNIFRPRQVIIAGAGPVGLTLAADLGERGVDVLIVDPSAVTTTNPRCNTTNARSMEYFRRLGVADSIRRAGLPLDHPTDVVYVTNLTGHELTRFPFSSSASVLDGTAPEFDDWPTPEPQHRISQIFLEPILEQKVQSLASVDLLRGWSVGAVTQTEASATVTLTSVSTGEEVLVEAGYVAGCDGGASVVRKSIGARLEGDSTAAEERLSVYFRSVELSELLGPDAGWMYWWYGPELRGSFLQLDGRGLFLCHARVPVGTDPEDLDPDVVLRAAIGRDVDHEKIQVIRWTPRRLIANTLQDGRVALAGDAAHLWLPLGGFGMNTGIADAIGLGWRLAALVSGTAGHRLLEDYEVERRSVGEATSHAALKIDRDMMSIGRDPLLHADDAAGEALRRAAAGLIETIDRKQWYSQGVQFGAHYSDSAGIHRSAVSRIGAFAAIDDYEPTVEPGARLPHFWRPGHRSLFDDLGMGWNLLCVDRPREAASAFSHSAAELGIDLRVVALPEPEASIALSAPYVLVRPDLFVAWSGEELPTDASALLRELVDGSPREAAALRYA